MAYIYPLKLKCVAKSTLWGGNRLSKKYNKPNIRNLGECWELSVREKEQNIILNGDCKGLTLGKYLKKYTDIYPDDFPVLIKFIDAGDKLSVQVHPQNEKTEMWHIIEAEKGAAIMLGLKRNLTKPEVLQAINDGSIENLLKQVQVSAGETYFIPAGTVHAIGAGIVLAEIQQNSDTTYRFYDYGRGRELHTEYALEHFKNFTDNEISALRFSKSTDFTSGEILASCEYFTVIKYNITKDQIFSPKGTPFTSLLCIEGEGKIKWKDGEEEINAGDSFFIPNGIETFEISGKLKLLSTTVQ